MEGVLFISISGKYNLFFICKFLSILNRAKKTSSYVAERKFHAFAILQLYSNPVWARGWLLALLDG